MRARAGDDEPQGVTGGRGVRFGVRAALTRGDEERGARRPAEVSAQRRNTPGPQTRARASASEASGTRAKKKKSARRAPSVGLFKGVREHTAHLDSLALPREKITTSCNRKTDTAHFSNGEGCGRGKRLTSSSMTVQNTPYTCGNRHRKLDDYLVTVTFEWSASLTIATSEPPTWRSTRISHSAFGMKEAPEACTHATSH